MAKFGAIVWRERFLAFAIHFVVTLALAACAAALIFIVWFPDPFQTMVGGTKLFELVVVCDLVLGPLISLVIYDSTKARWELIMDYSIIGAVQLAAMIYGVYIVAGTRPVYVAFNKDRIEVVTARDIDDKELAAARNPAYADLPLNGPRFVAVQVPPEDAQDALFQSLAGNEEHQRPKFFAPYETALVQIQRRARPVAALVAKFPASAPLVDAAMRGLVIPAERVRWLPVHHRQGFWTALVDNKDGKPVAYVAFDPYGD
jgi:hypothetical protein